MTQRRKDTSTIETLIQQIAIAVHDAAVEAQDPTSRELRFHPVRGWRFDLGMQTRRVAVELEGGFFRGHRTMQTIAALTNAGQALRPDDVKALRMMGGRHNKAAGMRDDLVKYNEAAALGWIVLRVMPEMITDGRALGWFEMSWQARKDLTWPISSIPSRQTGTTNSRSAAGQGKTLDVRAALRGARSVRGVRVIQPTALTKR